MRNKTKERQQRIEAQAWFDELDEDTQQETTIKYLRRLDNFSLKKLYNAVELYRKADAELEKVKEPEPEVEEENNEDDK